MELTAGRAELSFRRVVVIGVAIGGGILVAWLPVTVSGGLLVLIALLGAVLVEPALALLLMLSLAPLKTLIATEAPLPLPADIGQLTFALVVGAWIIWRVTQRRFTLLPFSRLHWALSLIMLAFVPSLFKATSTTAWIAEIIKWIEMGVLVLIVVDLGDQAQTSARGQWSLARWQWIAFGVVLAAGLQALIGLYEYRGGSGAPHLWIDFVHFRAFGTFGQPNPFSAFMGLSLPLALGLAWGYGWDAFNRWRNGDDFEAYVVSGFLAAMYAGFGLILLAGLLASWGRGAWLGFGAAGVVMACFAPRQRWLGILLVASGGTLVLLLWVTGLFPLSIQMRLESAVTEFTGFEDVRGAPISDENFAIVERLAHWQAAINMANDHPFLGVGLGNYEVVYADYRVPSWPNALGHAHNDYLNTLAETGLIGLIGYLAGWLVIGWWTLRALNQPDPVLRGLTLGLLGTWTHLAIHSIVDKLYVNNIFLHIGVMLGLLAVAYRHYLNSRMEES